jgi:hypothetical protein
MKLPIIKEPAGAVVKDKKSNMSAPKAKMPKGLGNTQAVENKGGQLSGVKKKRMTPVASIKNHS